MCHPLNLRGDDRSMQAALSGRRGRVGQHAVRHTKLGPSTALVTPQECKRPKCAYASWMFQICEAQSDRCPLSDLKTHTQGVSTIPLPYENAFSGNFWMEDTWLRHMGQGCLCSMTSLAQVGHRMQWLQGWKITLAGWSIHMMQASTSVTAAGWLVVAALAAADAAGTSFWRVSLAERI